MSQNSSNSQGASGEVKPKPVYRWWMAITLPAWVLAGFVAAQLIIAAALIGLKYVGVPLAVFNESVFNTVMAACIYVLTLVIVLGLPWWLKKRRTTKQDLGMTRLPSWADIGLAPAGFIVYLLLSTMLMYLVTRLVPGFNSEEAQSVGFDNLVYQYEFLLAFVTLVVVAPLAEEMLFRGYLYGKLRKSVPIWAAVAITSVLFGFIHGQWNVALDVFVLSIVMCGLREITGTIWAGVLLHMIKNGLAFYLLFINPSILHTIGG